MILSRKTSFTKSWKQGGILVKLEGFINQVLLEFLLCEPQKNGESFLPLPCERGWEVQDPI